MAAYLYQAVDTAAGHLVVLWLIALTLSTKLGYLIPMKLQHLRIKH